MATYTGEWEKTKVKSVDAENKGFSIGLESGFQIFMSGDYGVTPLPGDDIEVFGNNFRVNGVKLNGQLLFQTSDEQLEKERKEWLANKKAEDQKRYEDNKESYRKQVLELPKEFQDRLNRLALKRHEFWVEHGGYDLMVCVDAYKMASQLKTAEEVLKYQNLSWDDQQKKVSGLDQGHSGNSFGMAINLARLYLTHPEYVKFYHGALVHLVGCEGYGCHPFSEAEEAEFAALKR